MTGLTILPEYIQSEGVEGLLDHLQTHAPNITSIATSPYVMAEADREIGDREPPADAGSGSGRLLDRPLWGKREVWIETAPSFEPRRELYNHTTYQPPVANELTSQEGHVVAEFIEAAGKRGIDVLFQIQAAIPPCYRVQCGGPVEADRPRLPDGSLQQRRVAMNGSLAAENILSYTEALILDLKEQYPGIAGFRIDWPEYPPYFLDDLFLDFNEAVRPFAEAENLDFDDLRLQANSARTQLLESPDSLPGLRDSLSGLIRVKAALTRNLMKRFRSVVGNEKKLIPGLVPGVWGEFGGGHPAAVAEDSDSIFVKLYTMHWPMIVAHFRQQLLESNPNLDQTNLTRALVEWMDIDEWGDHSSSELYNYPDPETPHPVSRSSQTRKIEEAKRQAGNTPVLAIAHSYGPLEDFQARLQTARDCSPDGIWINRYAYVSDEKLDIIGTT